MEDRNDLQDYQKAILVVLAKNVTKQLPKEEKENDNAKSLSIRQQT
jgi:hypothetical protein